MEKNEVRFNEGLDLDATPDIQPKGTYRYARNVKRDSVEDAGLLSEEGTELCFELPEGHVIIGSSYIGDGRTVIFSTDNEISQIGVVQDCEYETIVQSFCLGFNGYRYLDTTHRVVNGCDDRVYFVGKGYPPRFFDVNKPERFKTDDEWDCNKFNLFYDYSLPSVDDMDVITGGSLDVGQYKFAFAYLDEDENYTNWIEIPTGVSIYKDSENSEYNSIDGDINYDTDEAYGVRPVNKSVEIDFSDLDDSFHGYKIAVVPITTGNGTLSRAFESPPQPISKTEFVFSGDLDGYTEIPLADLQIDSLNIDEAETVEQAEDKLLLGNTSTLSPRACDFQRFASKIKTKYVVNEVSAEDVVRGNAKDPSMDMITFPGDEIVPAGIIFFDEDGKEFGPYPIPGRPKDTAECDGGEDIVNIRYCLRIEGAGVVSGDNVYPTYWEVTYEIDGETFTESGVFDDTTSGTPDWEVVDVECVYDEDDIDIINFEYYNELPQGVATAEIDAQRISPVNIGTPVPDDSSIIDTWSQDLKPFVEQQGYDNRPDELKLERWQVYNTSVKDTEIETGFDSSGFMGYHECRDGVYPEKKTCDGKDYWGVDYCGNELSGNPIRHHRIPDRIDEPLTEIGDITSQTTEFYIRVTGEPTGNLTVDVDYDINATNFTDTINVDQGDVPTLILVDSFSGTQSDITVNSITPSDPEVDASASFQTTTETEGEGKLIRLIGMKFSNIEYPEGIVGHYFVRGKRDDENKTVLDTGFAGRARGTGVSGEQAGMSYFGSPKGTDDNFGYYYMPKVLHLREDLGGSYLKVLKKHSGVITSQDAFDINKNYIAERVYDFCQTENTDVLHMVPDFNELLDPLETTYEGTIPVTNITYSNPVNIFREDQIENLTEDEIYTVSLKQNKEVFCDLDSIEYVKMQPSPFKSEQPRSVFGGDMFINPMGITNYMFRSSEEGWADNILQGIIGAVQVVIGAVTGQIGVAVSGIKDFIAWNIQYLKDQQQNLQEGRYGYILEENGLDNIVEDVYDNVNDAVIYHSEHAGNIFIESDINIGLRHITSQECDGRYQLGQGVLTDYVKGKLLDISEEDGQYQPRPLPCQEIYNYNPDYTADKHVRTYFSIPRQYDCCSDCLEEFPNRIYYSETSFDNELADNYRVFLPNNFIDIESRSGEIKDLIRLNDRIYAACEEEMFYLPKNNQIIAPEDGGILSFLGTGSFFSIPERVLIDTETGAFGTEDRLATVKTEQGVFVVNQRGRNIFRLGQQGKIISGERISNWIEQNITIKEDHPFFRHISTYDPDNKRILFTKRAYEPLLPVEQYDGTYKANTIVKREDQFGITRVDGSFEPIEFENPDYFENKSYTLSYQNGRWVSFHSYIPDWYFYDHETFYSSKENKVYRHGAKKYAHYYGKDYAVILEPLNASQALSNKMTEDIRVIGRGRSYDPLEEEFVDAPNAYFDKAVFYNSFQSSGEQPLEVKEFMKQSQNVTITREERDWYINELIDWVVGYDKSLFSKQWDKIKSEYPIDKVPNEDATNPSKNWTELQPFRDKYFAVRLFFTDPDVQLIVNFVVFTEQISHR